MSLLGHKRKNIEAREISKELGVRYVLEGSVQRDQNRVRVNAQLIDGKTGAHLWADRFEEHTADVFKLQDQVVARLANTLGSELVKAEAERSTHSGNPDAIDLTMRGWAILNQPQLYADKDSLAKALDLFEQALKLDPNNVDALVGAALAERNNYIYSGMDETPGQIAKIEKLLATRNQDRSDECPSIHRSGNGLQRHQRNKEAAEAAQNAVRLNPSYASAYAELAMDEMTPAELPLAIANIDQAMKLARGSRHWPRRWIKGGRRLHGPAAGRDPGIAAALDSGYSARPVYAQLGTAYASLVRQSEAEAAVAQARKLNPEFDRRVASPRGSTLPEVYFEGLRKAGLPEE